MKAVVFTAFLILALLFPGSASIKANPNGQGLIAVQGAMDVEISALLKAMGDYKQETYGSYSYFIGKISDIPVVVSRTGIGMVNAAASTAILIDHYHPKAIINQGTAGGHDPNIHVFDTVIGAEVLNLDRMESQHLDAGQGIHPRNWKFTKTEIRENGKIKGYTSFKSDPQLVKSVLRIASQYKHGKVVVGKIGSTDFWNREVDRILWFHNTAGTSAEEMEGAAVAQVAKGFHVPFLSFRTISNSEVSGDKTVDLSTAGQYSAAFAIKIIKELGN